MQLADLGACPKRGVVLDYVTINSDQQSAYTFRGDTTYYLSGYCNFDSGMTFEGCTVLKYAAGAMIDDGGPVIWNTGPYRPAVMTAVDDNTVGETIPGSTGAPSGFYALYALCMECGMPAPVHDVRIAYAQSGLYTPGPNIVRDCQFINLGTALSWFDDLQVENCLLANVDTAFDDGGSGSTVGAVNVTAHDIGTLFVSTVTLSAANCLFVAVTNWGGAFTMVNSATTNSDTGVFQTAGGGSHYLATNSPYRNAGTTSIDPRLVADLATKTTYPPIVYSNVTFSVATNFSPQAQRDSDTPDLGYHYDPLDYITDTLIITNAQLTVSNGTAIACYNRPGISLQDGSSIVSVGTPVKPNWFVRYQSVQEQSVALGGTNVFSGQNVSAAPYGNTGPNGTFQFTHFATPAAGGWDFYHRSNSVFGNLTLQNNELWGGANDLSGSTNATSVTLNNNLFWRSSVFASNTSAQASLYLTNNLFWGSSVTLSQPGSGLWNAFNNDFDTCSITNSLLTNGYNAYLNCIGRLYPTNAFDIVSGNSLAYQTGWLGNYYLPTNSPLIKAGSTTADRVGLYHYTVTTNEVIEGTNTVSIGYHYVAVDTNGIPLDTDGDGIPDYLEDANGDGVYDTGDLSDWTKFSTDGTGMSDGWEIKYFGHIGVDPNADPDGDGLSNLQEYQAGTDPTVDNSTVPGSRLNYLYDLGGWLNQVSGIKSGTVIPDFEGNIKTVSQ
jgi:hypothetical protein